MIDALTATSPMSGTLATGNLMSNLSSGAALSNATGMDKVAQDFEGMFMSQMLQPMFEGLQTDTLFGGGHGEEIMRSFMVQEYGKSIAHQGHFGLADSIKKAMLLRAQGKAEGQADRSPSATPAVMAAAYQQGQNTTVNDQTP